MRFRRPFRSRTHFLVFDITPMVDIVFLLIIFFMTAAQFARITRAELELPVEQGEQDETSDEAGLIVNIDAQGRILLGSDADAVTLEELEGIVQEEILRQAGGEARELKLLIRADRTADTRRLNEVVTLLQGQGVGAARIATKVPR
ncbi:MAG: ExbD/TolR family protein [Planctomycetota bacterium]|jgi:biopolymer transport protein ExbD